MRIRKIKEKDAAAAAALMRKCDAAVSETELVERLRDFLYKRDHMAVVVCDRGAVIALMHMGIVASLTHPRTAYVLSRFIDAQTAPDGMEERLQAFFLDWARQHGCMAAKVMSGPGDD